MLHKTNVIIASLTVMSMLAWNEPVSADVLHEAHLTGFIEDHMPFGGGYTGISFHTTNSSGYNEYWSEGGSNVAAAANQAWMETEVDVNDGLIELQLEFSHTLVFDEPTWVTIDAAIYGALSYFVSVPNGTYLVEANEAFSFYGSVEGFIGVTGEMDLDLMFDPVSGACCLINSCQLMGQADCETAGGMWLPGQLECLENTCDVAYGACCTNDTCVMEFLDAGDCLIYGGTWLGPGSNCDQCEKTGEGCAGDLDGDGDVDVLDLLAIIDAWGDCP